MKPLAALLALAILAAPAAYAQDAVVDAAQASGLVGEQADGYLGVRGDASSDIRARVDQINIKRRAAYTDLATKRGVTVGDVAAATACQIQDSVGSGQYWRDEGGQWQQRGSGALAKPSYCG